MIRKMTILWAVLAGFIVLSVSSPARTEPADESTQSAGWSPAQASDWMVAQMKYAQAVKQYGKDSPEATQAQVMMNTMARDLGVKPNDDVPEEASMAPPAVESDSDESASAVHRSSGTSNSAAVDPDRPQPAPQEVTQATGPTDDQQNVRNTASPTPAPTVADPPADKP